MRVVICGGGVIGARTALFLALRRVEVIIIERTGVANAASGRAGGFLAYDWCAGLPLDALARRSFTLHAQLPGEIKGDWGYRRMSAYAGFVFPEADVCGRIPSKLGWLSDGVTITTPLGTPETTAIVYPALFTTAVMQAAQEHGARLRSGVVTGILRRGEESVVRGVEASGEVIAAIPGIIELEPRFRQKQMKARRRLDVTRLRFQRSGWEWQPAAETGGGETMLKAARERRPRSIALYRPR